MAYSWQVCKNANVRSLLWTESSDESYSEGDWHIRQQRDEAHYLEAIDTDHYAARLHACYSETSTTYESPTEVIIEEEAALRLQAMVISQPQIQDQLTYSSQDKYTLNGERMTLIICDPSREGSQYDIQRVVQFCKHNQFHCYQSDQFSKKGLMRDLKNFRDSLDENTCCLAIFIMAHGQLGHINVDDGQIELQRIFEIFDNRRCPALRGKPKLFVVQACRGIGACAKYPCCDGNGLTGASRESLWPLESDFLLVYAVCPGNLAICYPESGSPLFEEMSNVFPVFADSKSVTDLFTMVNDRLSMRKETVGFKTDRLRPWQTEKNLVMPGIGRRVEREPSVGGPLHIVSCLTKKWFL